MKQQLALGVWIAKGLRVKVQRNGQATVLSPEQLDQLLDAAPSPRYRALWALQ